MGAKEEESERGRRRGLEGLRKERGKKMSKQLRDEKRSEKNEQGIER